MPANNKHITIGGVETFSVVDYPGKISAVVFMQGCPWRCPFCYNKHLQTINQETNFIWENFFEFLKKRQGILEAVVFSGGEPLVQDGLENAIDEVKALGYQIGLHTGGYRPELLEKILPNLSWIGFDIKAPFGSEKYKKAIGVEVALPQVIKSLDLVINAKIDFECRTTCDPRILIVDDIYNIAKELKEKGIKKYHLQKYRPIPSDKTTKEEDCDKFFYDENLIKFLKETFEKVELRS